MKIVITWMMLLATFNALSQDLIVTHKGDSLNCKILSSNDKGIVFKYLVDNQVKKTFIGVEHIDSYQYSYFTSTLLPQDKNYQGTRLSGTIGLGYRLNKVATGLSSAEREYWRKMKSGLDFDLKLVHYFNNKSGVGLKANRFYTSLNNTSVKIDFLGPVYAMQNVTEKGRFVTSMGLGLLNYTYSYYVYGVDSNLKGSTLGLNIDVGYEFKIVNQLNFVTNLGLTSGVLNSISVNGGSKVQLSKEESEGLVRLGLSAGLSYKFK